MGWLEIVLLCAVALWLIATVIYLIRHKGKTCGGDCENCRKACKRE